MMNDAKSPVAGLSGPDFVRMVIPCLTRELKERAVEIPHQVRDDHPVGKEDEKRCSVAQQITPHPMRGLKRQLNEPNK
ncbi:hypothetical protein [Mediterranea massiliensis]|uniref:hypothetical protein n=1 Tax=Mediterranea massiliensis TaxID=1841865 RepID=UPI0025A38B9D|nr:hypothetical protein [Mediterranea massiliensis]MDM8338667.1 hypothetical protein [Mediterranea massiliensis]